MDAIQSALNGLRAQGQRLGVAANNIANAYSAGPVPEDDVTPAEGEPAVYRPVEIQNLNTIIDGQGAGPLTRVIEKDPAYSLVYDPSSSLSNDEGYIAVPNVSLEEEIINVQLAGNLYKANLKVLEVADEMMDSLLDIET